MTFNRRQVLKFGAVALSLPLFTPRMAGAQATVTRKRFIGCYTPNGAYMPSGADGNWTFEEALAPLVSRGLRNNTMILRGLHAGFPGADPHWQNCAGFLSCHPIELGDPGVARCAVSLDQHVAERHPSPLRSLEVGGIYYHVHPLNDHPGYSNDYLNRISWQTPDKFRSPIPLPEQMFAKLFGGEAGSAAQIAWTHARKKSVLDQLHKDATRMGARLGTQYSQVLQSYMDTVREVEAGLASTGGGCAPGLPRPTDDFSQPNTNYALRFRLMHQMIVQAMQCGLTNVATIMYGPGVSESINFVEALGAGNGHHACAHHGNAQGAIDRIKAMNAVQAGLFADLVERLKTAHLLEETLLIYGSDMSDGNVHHTENLPMLLCGAGADLKFGQVIGDKAVRRPLSDLHADVARLLNVTGVSQFGSGVCASTGQSLPMFT